MSTARESRILTGSRLITSTRVGGEIWDRVKNRYGSIPDDGRQRLRERTPDSGSKDCIEKPADLLAAQGVTQHTISDQTISGNEKSL